MTRLEDSLNTEETNLWSSDKGELESTFVFGSEFCVGNMKILLSDVIKTDWIESWNLF
jgi:hypothetical protein